MYNFIVNVLQIFGIVYLRFRAVPRVWNVWLVGVNLACLYFIGHIEAQVLLAVTLLAVAGQGFIYDKIGFTRVLGIVHIMWIPMFAWMATRLESIMAEPVFAAWVATLFATNMVSLIIDTTDVVRFLRGEKAPHYNWAKPQS